MALCRTSSRFAPGEYNATVDSGFYKYAKIGDKVWNDTNGNGIQDTGETGKAGVKVELYTCGVNDQPGALARRRPPTPTATTASAA